MRRCSICKEECGVKEIDTSIGSYEFHGARGTHRARSKVSDCCEARILSEGEYQTDLENEFRNDLEDFCIEYTDKDMSFSLIAEALHDQVVHYKCLAGENEDDN